MRLEGKRVGFALTGSHCTLTQVIPVVQQIVTEGADVLPIASEAVATTDTRFGAADTLLEDLQKITGKRALTSIMDVEPIGPKMLLDILIVAPCTGNTLAKLANGITDSPVLMAIKAHLRNRRPVVLAIATNDGLGMNARNLGILINTPCVFLVPFGQDDPKGKPNSLIARMDQILDTVTAALDGEQIQPLLVERTSAHV